MNQSGSSLNIGWAQGTITPELNNPPVMLSGQFHVRIAEGVMDPLTVTSLALVSGGIQIVLVSCDLIAISNELRDEVRKLLDEQNAGSGPDPRNVIIQATHTHAGPDIRLPSPTANHLGRMGCGVELDVTPIAEYIKYAAWQISQTVIQAWGSLQPGKISHGHGYTHVGNNRRWVDAEGIAVMYGLSPKASGRFRHIEGGEDDSIQLMATYDLENNLTGMIMNLPCPSQIDDQSFLLSADFWHETRCELRQRYGEQLFIMPQCSAAGDLSPRSMLHQKEDNRMLRLKGITLREQIAKRIADEVDDILPYIVQEADAHPTLSHVSEEIDLPMNKIKESEVQSAMQDAKVWQKKYEAEQQMLKDHPELLLEKRWYIDITKAYRRMHWYLNVARRFEDQRTTEDLLVLPVEVHIFRLGKVVFATNPFEMYLDFGNQIKLRSPFSQTFLVQLAGGEIYLPSPRSVRGGGYGAIPSSNPVGPAGGQLLVERTVSLLRRLQESPSS